MALSTRALRKIIEIVDVLHSVPDNIAMIRAVCEKLQRHIGICSGVFTYADPKTNAYLISGWFFDRNHLNVSARNTDLVPENVFVRREFACDFLLPVANVFYSIAGTLASQGDVVARVGFHARSGRVGSAIGTRRLPTSFFPI